MADIKTKKKRPNASRTAVVQKPNDRNVLPFMVQVAGDVKLPSLGTMFPAWGDTSPRETTMVGMPATGSGYYNATGGPNFTPDGTLTSALGLSCAADEVPLRRTLPDDRNAQYAILDIMFKDPTIACAIEMHIGNALSARDSSVDPLEIKRTDGITDKPDKIVDDLKNTLMPIVRENLHEWARQASVLGTCFVRVYGEKGIGVTNVRNDFYTQPQYIMKYEKGGRLAGYTATYQGTNLQSRELKLLPPWTFVEFQIPENHIYRNLEPIKVTGELTDLAVEDPGWEGLVESQKYGTSLLSTSFGPWMDLLDALTSLRMSRRNAARLERILGVNTGRMDPERAAKYLDAINERIGNATQEIQSQSYLRGNVQTVVNHIIPNFQDKGGLQIETVQGTPDINGLEDVLFHVKRLGSSLGADPSLLGFGDFLAGGLGDGGFFRMSIIASIKANLIRKAIANGLDRLCELHCAYKYGKAFTTNERPWKLEFNSVNTAVEREAQEAMEARSNLVGGIVGALSAVDQEFSFADKRELFRKIWTMCRLDDESFDTVFPESKQKEAEERAKAEQDAFNDDEQDDYKGNRLEKNGEERTKHRPGQEDDDIDDYDEDEEEEE